VDAVVVIAVAAVVIVLLLVIGVVTYNRFIQQRQYIDNAWANVESELQRRYDLVPNLVETVKAYAAHERDTFEAVIRARSVAQGDHGDPAHQAASENMLVGALKSLFAVSEAYPDLKANVSFLDLQDQLVTTEDRIQASRRFYNNNVRAYNERVQSVPSNVVARLFGFDLRSYFDIEQAVRTGPAPEVTFERGD
jgi:LemA protein